MVAALTLLLFGPPWGSVIELLAGYVAAYLLIGVCIFGPARKLPSLRQGVAFLLPGALLVPLALLNLGFWAGGWLLGLPAWGLLLSRWTPEDQLKPVQLLKFLGLMVLGLVIFTFNVVYPVFSIGLFLLPIIPLARLAFSEYRSRLLQSAAEVLLAITAAVLALVIPTPDGSWSSPLTCAGGAATAGLMMAYWAWGLPRRSSLLRQFDNGAVV